MYVIMSRLHSFFNFVKKIALFFTPTYVRSLSRFGKIRYAVSILLGILIIFRLLGSESPGINPTRTPEVTTKTVIELQNGSSYISAVGEVESLEQVELRAQVSERVRGIAVNIGQAVTPGQVLVTLENATLVASRDQAAANVAVAEARLAEVLRGARPQEIRIQETAVNNARIARDESLRTLHDRLNAAFTTADDALQNRVDQLFVDGDVAFPELVFFSGDTQLDIDIKNQRFLIGKTLETWGAETRDDTKLVEESRTIRDRLTEMKNFLNDVATAVNNLTPTSAHSQTTIDAWKATILVARNNIDAGLSSVLAAEEKLQTTEANLQLAEEQLSLLQEGSAEEQIASARASLSAAKAQLALAEAQLGRTIIRSPIRGNVSSIPARVGNLVNPGERVVSVVNPGGLQIRAFVNSRDRALIAEGSDALIESTILGAISRVAPSIDPVTKKVEVIVAITEPDAPLLAGEFANVEIAIQEEQRDQTFLIPLNAIKITNAGPGVYTINNESIIEFLPVTLGRVIGNAIEVLDGITFETVIVENVRGVDIGEVVTVK